MLQQQKVVMDGSDIEDGSSDQTSNNAGKVHYIDVISIIQELNL